jgi:hypothetical protein
LFWDEKTFSFYNSRIQDEKIQNGSEFDGSFSFRQNLERNRKKIMGLPALLPRMWQDEAVEDYWKGIGVF